MLPGSERSGRDRGCPQGGHPRDVAGGGPQVAGVPDGSGLGSGLPAAPGIPDTADGVVHPAAVADPERSREQADAARDGGRQHHPRREEPAHSGALPGQPADGGRRGADHQGAGADDCHACVQARRDDQRQGFARGHQACGSHARDGGGHVPDHGHRQLRGPLRHSHLAQGCGGAQLQRYRQLRFQLRQRLLVGLFQ